MVLYNLLRLVTPNASVAVSELGADATTTAALGQAVENLDTYATRNNGTNTGTASMTLNASLAAQGSFKLSGADISGTNGGQIVFPASQVASSNANTLDDYAEVTWTPSVGGTATYTTQICRYQKFGKRCHAYCNVTINA